MRSTTLLTLALVSLLAAATLALWIARELGVPGSGEGGVVLHVLTRHDATTLMIAREAFLNSTFAREAGVTDVVFIKPNPALWRDTIDRLGYLDVAWGGGPTAHNILADDGYLLPIEDEVVLHEASSIPDSVGGMPLKRFDSQGRLLWVATSMSSFGIIVNLSLIHI